MEITHKILKNGDLEFTVKFEDDKERSEVISSTKGNYPKAVDLFWDNFSSDFPFRFVTGEEQIYYGDIYSGNIITDIEMKDYIDPSKSEEIEERTWYYQYYITTISFEELFEKGKVVWTCRKNLHYR